MSIKIEMRGSQLALTFLWSHIDYERAKSIPERRFDSRTKAWIFKPTLQNMSYVKQWFPTAQWDEAANEQYDEAKRRAEQRDSFARGSEPVHDDLDAVAFKLPPFKHQRTALLGGRDKEVFAYLMEQGTGKSKVLLDDAAHNFRKDRIDRLLIIAPNSVKTNWVDPNGGTDEVSTHMAPDIPYVKACYVAQATQSTRHFIEQLWKEVDNPSILKLLAVNVEGLSSPRAIAVCEDFLSKGKAMIVVDESTKIKNRTAKRTKSCLRFRARCDYARIMSGTPIIKSPLDSFSQFSFLSPDILGYTSYYGFRNRYAIMGGYMGYQVMNYCNLDELTHRIAGVSYRVLKDDCLDLPPKLYSKRYVEMTDQQWKLYEQTKEQARTHLEELRESSTLETTHVLTQLMRLQQITSGFYPIFNEMGDQVDIKPIMEAEFNPKVQEIVELIQETNGKVIVWCKFRQEIFAMMRALEKEGIKHVVFYGDVKETDRVTARQSFQSDPSVQVFVGQVRTGGIGITLHAANTVIYFSNSFSTEDRVQSEDRAHRIGQTKSVDYVDIVVPATIDVKIISVLRNNKHLSDQILKDGIKEWI